MWIYPRTGEKYKSTAICPYVRTVRVRAEEATYAKYGCTYMLLLLSLITVWYYTLGSYTYDELSDTPRSEDILYVQYIWKRYYYTRLPGLVKYEIDIRIFDTFMV